MVVLQTWCRAPQKMAVAQVTEKFTKICW
jgi:hypothetical protein